MPYKHALTVFDGSAESENLLDMVCGIVRPHRAQLTILHVKLVPLTAALPKYDPAADPETAALLRKAEKFAEKRGVKAASAVRYARVLGSAVVAEARVCGVDLVALLAPDIQKPTPTQTLDSDIEIVLRKATCAVLLCRPSR